MQSIAKSLLIAILAVLAAALVTALSVQWPDIEYSVSSPQTGASARTFEDAGMPTPRNLAEPLVIAKAFGYVSPVIRVPEPVLPEPVVIPETPVAWWIQSIGFVTTVDGSRRYVLKLSSPRESIISLGVGESARGILLVEVEENSLVIQTEEERYLVPLPPK